MVFTRLPLSRFPNWDSRQCLGFVVAFCLIASSCNITVNAQEVAPSQPDNAVSSSAPSTASTPPQAAPKEFRPIDLASVDQLVLVLSNSTDEQGKNRQEVLVFLGRSKNRGWEKIGDSNIEEIAEHWRGVAQRQLTAYSQAGLSSEQLEKVTLAVEVSIAQFQRLYRELRTDFLDQPDQKSRLAILASDSRYERLRQMGREGLFREQSLVGKVIHKALNEPLDSTENR